MAEYVGSIDISLIRDIDGKTITSIKNVYYSSLSTNIEDIPSPYIASKDVNKVLRVSEGIIKVDEGVINVTVQESEWSYDKPEFVYGFHLWTSIEVLTDDGVVVYSEPIISADWESYYNMDVGGTNLIRNSKTLIDERIFFE